MIDIKLINFLDLNLDEKKMILSWRNNPKIKQWMYNQEDISLEEHLSFIDSLKNKEDKLYFLVIEKNQNLGVIDFTKIKKNKSLHMGIYVNPNLKGKGRLLLNLIINYSFDKLKVKTIYSEVFEENKKAYELYKKFNFIVVNTKYINNKEVICMELENENR